MASRRLRERGDKHDPYRWEAQPWQAERDEDDKPPPEPEPEPVPIHTTH